MRITLLDFFPNPDFCRFLKTSTPILIRVYFWFGKRFNKKITLAIQYNNNFINIFINDPSVQISPCQMAVFWLNFIMIFHFLFLTDTRTSP
ncbi:hypothetical protein [Moraxella lacunata]|uniref:hypothetical protein n=1 Tax=Moraxella lacunata TaxID=477 RepID=UPI003EE1BC7D